MVQTRRSTETGFRVDPLDVPRPGALDDDLYAERMRNERRLLYVGLTRAMRGLLLSVPADCEHEALTNLDHTDWHEEKAAE